MKHVLHVYIFLLCKEEQNSPVTATCHLSGQALAVFIIPALVAGITQVFYIYFGEAKSFNDLLFLMYTIIHIDLFFQPPSFHTYRYSKNNKIKPRRINSEKGLPGMIISGNPIFRATAVDLSTKCGNSFLI